MTKVRVRDGETLLVSSAAAESGDTIVKGAIIGRAKGDANDDDNVVIETCGVFTWPKAAGFAVVVGDLLYWDAADENLNSDSYGNPLTAVATEVAASDATAVTAMLLPEAFAAAWKGSQELQFVLTPPSGVAATKAFDWIAPAAGQFDEIILTTAGRPSSASGTVVETVTNLAQASPLVGATNVLTAASVELKAGIVNDTPLTPALSATLGNKQFAAGDHIRFAIAASNADVVAGAGISHRVRWHRR